jgi:hypothetical protein
MGGSLSETDSINFILAAAKIDEFEGSAFSIGPFGIRVGFAYLVGEMFSAKSAAALKRYVAKLRELISDGDAAVVTRYDRWRYQALLEFVNKKFDVSR